MNNEYNGWVNYETWNISLWLNNEEGYYHDLQTLTSSAWSTQKLAEYIENYVREVFELNGGSFGDLESEKELNRVDWEEIARAEMDEYEANNAIA
jgi:hypothetical protein